MVQHHINTNSTISWPSQNQQEKSHTMENNQIKRKHNKPLQILDFEQRWLTKSDSLFTHRKHQSTPDLTLSHSTQPPFKKNAFPLLPLSMSTAAQGQGVWFCFFFPPFLSLAALGLKPNPFFKITILSFTFFKNRKPFSVYLKITKPFHT